MATKLRAPSLPRWLLPRRRLVSQLDDAIETGLVLVSAPAGFGKTMAVAEWAATLQEPLGWLSLDEADSDPIRFWRYVVAAIERASPGASQRIGPVAAGGELALNSLVTSLINVVAETGRRVTVVIDGYDVIASPVVDATLGHLLSHRPSDLAVVLTTRSDPALPIARLRLDGELAEIGTADLRFRPEEVEEFLRSLPAAPEFSGTEVASLTARTEGWPAGVRLAGMTLAGHHDPARLLGSFSGSHRYVVDFLTTEVLERQEPDVRRFLEETAVLGRLTAGLCDTVTGRDDSQTLLEKIERSNLFLEPLDERRGWWRYHRVFADALRDRLEANEPERAKEIHRRAARWYRSRGIAEEAIAHAFAAGEVDEAAAMVEENVDELFLLSERATLETWLGRFPAPLLDRRPRLLLAHARLALQLGDPTAATLWLDKAEAALGESGSDPTGFAPSVGTALSITANPSAALAMNRAIAAEYSGDHRATLRLMGQAAALATEEELVLLAVVRGHMGIAEWLGGRLDAAEAHLADALRMCRIADQPSLGAWVGYYQGAIDLARGDLRAAERTYNRILEETAPPGSPPLPAAGVAHAGLASVALERDRLDDARDHLDAAMPLCRALAFSPPWASSLATLARLKWARGDLAGAITVLEQEGREAAPRYPVVSVLDPVRAERARIASIQGDHEAVLDWVGTGSEHHPAYVREAEDLARSRLSIRRGDPGRALGILTGLGQCAAAENRRRSLIEIRLVEALARSAASDHEGALGVLRAAVDLAAETGHVQLFVEQGEALNRLLADLISEPTPLSERSLAHLGAIRNAMSSRSTRPSADRSAIIDPLSARELEVLELVASGRSNAQIAEDLYIAIDTVKRHMTHILAKLGASNRTEAAARARRLGIVD